MEQINKFKWWIIAGIAVLILFSAKSCVDTRINELRGENKILKEQGEQAREDLKQANQERHWIKDSIASENVKKEQKIKEQAQIIASSEERIKDLMANNAKTKKEIKNLTLIGVAKELNDTYGGNNATAKEKSVELNGSMPYQVLETIADVNTCADVVKEKDIQLVAKDSVITVKDSQLKDSSVLLFSAEKTIKKHEELDKIQTDLNKNLEKENKKLKTKSFLNKVLIPVGVAVGTFVGYSIAK